MKRLLIIVLALAAAGGALAQGYSKGTLHRATLRDWRAASSQDQLATATDLVGNILRVATDAELKSKASDVQGCVSKAAANFMRGSELVSDNAVACIVQLGFLKKR